MSHYKPYPVYKDSGVEFNNTAEQALLGDFSKAVDDAVMDSGAAHHNQMMQYLSSPQLASGFARVIFDLMLAGKEASKHSPPPVD